MLTENHDAGTPDAVAPPERRAGGKRHQSVLLVGRVLRDGHDAACLVHDISHHGLMARFSDVPAVGDELVIEVRGLAPVAGTVRWVKDRKAGLEFTAPLPLDTLARIVGQ